MSGEDWSEAEVRAIVDDYFAMLALELAGQPYSKAAHRAQLRRWLVDRTDGAIEFKHGNIRSVLLHAGFPYISGYKPYGNRQELLAAAVLDRIESDRQVNELVAVDVERPAVVPEVEDILGVLEDPPTEKETEPRSRPAWLSDRPVHTNYLAREAQNRSLGAAGEEFVLRYERERLSRAGHAELARLVEHTSRVRGDQAGFDIRSYDSDGSKRLIEVKTTSYGERVPFFVSRNELRVSEAEPACYRVYRLHSFRRQPRLFVLAGSINATCTLDPATYVARVRPA